MGADAEIIRRITNEIFVEGDFSHFDDLVDDSFVDRDPMPDQPNDKKGLRQMAEMVVAAFSDGRMELEDIVETTDGRVVENWLFACRHTGEAMGIPPSGKDVKIRGLELWRVADGKLVERWGVIDINDVLEKAGLIPG